MKRSEINSAIKMTKEALAKHNFHLPPFAFWTPEQWQKAGPECDRIKINGLGWDISDFGRGDFDNLGGILFTLRNGNHAQPDMGTPYAEKAIIMKPGQRMPIHFHWSKTEDIINRGGGVLVMQLYNSFSDESVDKESPVTVYCDGCERTIPAGGTIEFGHGESITIPPRLYHLFWAKKDAGLLICGEVSKVNDDQTDNCFAEPVSRFADIEEDEAPIHLLCNEYPK